MHTAIITLIILIFSFSLKGQVRDLNGVIIDNANNPIPFVKVAFRKGDVIVNGATTDFDGKYTIRNVSSSLDSIEMEIKPFECFQGKSSTDIVLENDSTIKTIVLESYNCDSIAETQSKFHNDSCDIYEVKYLWDSPRGKRRYCKMEKENEKIEYKLPEYYLNECCEKTHFCKTHNYRY